MPCFKIADKVTQYNEDFSLSETKQARWENLLADNQYQQLSNRRDQIAFAFDILCDKQIPSKDRFTHDQLAKKFGISRQFLKKQVDKRKNGVLEPHRPSQLSTAEKEQLIVHLRSCWSAFEYPRYDDISFFIESEFQKIISDDSLRKIVNEMKDVCKVIEADPIEEKRYDVILEQLEQYFNKLDIILPLINFRFCFNIDETGEDTYVDATSVKVIVPSDFAQTRAKIPVGRGQKRFTIVHCISTDGEFIPPFLIIPRKSVDSDLYYIYDPRKLHWRYQQRGFMTDELFAEYFQNHFIAYLEQKRKVHNYTGPALLLMDNLLAHKKAVGCPANSDYIFIGELNLHVLFLVPHSSDQHTHTVPSPFRFAHSSGVCKMISWKCSGYRPKQVRNEILGAEFLIFAP